MTAPADSRDAFEQWVTSRLWFTIAKMRLDQNARGEYKDYRVNAWWTAWQAALAQYRAVGVPGGWEIDEDGKGFIRVKSPSHEMHIGFMPGPSREATEMLRDLAIALLPDVTE